MVALGFFFIAFFAVGFWKACKRDFSSTRYLKLCLYSLPLPWLAAEFGWFVAEFGRQPWAVDGMLPTFLGSSSLSLAKVLFTLGGFVLFYSSLLVVDIVLMRKTIRLGPVQALGLKRPAAPAAIPQPAE
jgi:cytochrome d ubiquinol oxidase subunit I